MHNTYKDGRTLAHPELLTIWHNFDHCREWPWRAFIAWAKPRFKPGMVLIRPDTTKPLSSDNAEFSDHAMKMYIGRRKPGKSGVRGVYWRQDRNCYSAYINVGGKRINLGVFQDLASASAARSEAELAYYGRHPQEAA